MFSTSQWWRIRQPQPHFYGRWDFNWCSSHFHSPYACLTLWRIIQQGYFWVHTVKNEAEQNDEEKDKNLEESAYSFHKTHEKSNIDILELKKTKKISFLADDDEEENLGFFKKNKYFFLSVDTVENRAPCFFGHFSIIMCACIMYSPFIYQTVMGLIYLIMMILMLIFEAWKYCRSVKFVVGGRCYIILVGYCMNLGMAASVVVGVGLANWDEFKISCYYTSLKIWIYQAYLLTHYI